MSNDTVSTNDDSIENQNPSADTFLLNLPYDDAEDIFDVRHNLPAEVSDATTPERALAAQLLRVEQDRMQQCADAIAKVDGFTFDSIIAFSSLKPVPSTFQPANGRLVFCRDDGTNAVVYWLYEGHMFSTEPPTKACSIDAAIASAENAENEHLPVTPVGLFSLDMPEHTI